MPCLQPWCDACQGQLTDAIVKAWCIWCIGQDVHSVKASYRPGGSIRIVAMDHAVKAKSTQVNSILARPTIRHKQGAAVSPKKLNIRLGCEQAFLYFIHDLATQSLKSLRMQTIHGEENLKTLVIGRLVLERYETWTEQPYFQLPMSFYHIYWWFALALSKWGPRARLSGGNLLTGMFEQLKTIFPFSLHFPRFPVWSRKKYDEKSKQLRSKVF